MRFVHGAQGCIRCTRASEKTVCKLLEYLEADVGMIITETDSDLNSQLKFFTQSGVVEDNEIDTILRTAYMISKESHDEMVKLNMFDLMKLNAMLRQADISNEDTGEIIDLEED